MITKKNIVLIGFMGSGKTTIGKVLASYLQYQFIDTDDLIVKKEKRDISSIFKNQGESYFRKIENSVLQEVMKLEKCVVSTGGGIVTTLNNKKLLTKGIIVYLKATPKQIYHNIKDDQSRPLLQEKDVYGTISVMLKDRESLYEQMAHYIVEVDKKTPKAICKAITNKLK